ncbi:hypothetical protein DFQ29_004847 [Apophysomyces sp. BC1021]|nr:hypothetical protein DFQ29_004847 [Apophysomyces sp. BC1021]
MASSRHFFFFSSIPIHQQPRMTQPSDLARLCDTYTTLNNAMKCSHAKLKIQTTGLSRSPSVSSIESDAYSCTDDDDNDDNYTAATSPDSPIPSDNIFAKPLDNRTLYYGSTEARAYLRQKSFDDVLKYGFDHRSDSMTLRITLTPWHGRATDTEIYGRFGPAETKSVASSSPVCSPPPSSPVLMTSVSLLPPPRPKKPRASHPPNSLFIITPSQPHLIRRVHKQPLLLVRRR